MYRRLLQLSFLLPLLIAAEARATTVIAAPLDELAFASQIIFHGVVRVVDDERATSPAGPFETLVELEVLEPVKGLPPAQRIVTVTFPGGRARGRTMRIAGMPQFRPGDEVVLLLERNPSGSFALTGLSQGAFLVERSGAVPTVRRNLGGLALLSRNGAPPKQEVLAAPQTLPDLLDLLRAGAQGGSR